MICVYGEVAWEVEPLIRPEEAPHLWVPEEPGARIEAPVAAVSPTALVVEVDVKLWAGGPQVVACQLVPDEFGWYLGVTADRRVVFGWSSDGEIESGIVVADVPLPHDRGSAELRAAWLHTGGLSTAAVSWRRPGDEDWTTAGQTSVEDTGMYASDAPVEVGNQSFVPPLGDPPVGELIVRRVSITRNGSPLVDLDLASWPVGDTSHEDVTGNTWTAEGGAVVRPSPWVRLDLDAVQHPVVEHGDPVVEDGDPLVWTEQVGSAVSGVRELSTSRGCDTRTGEVRTGTASATVDNRFGQLSRATSPWPVRQRRRIRFVVEPEAGERRVIWTGFIDRLPPRWEPGDAWVDLECSDMLALIGEVPLPPSVLHAVTSGLGPVAYWPLAETSGKNAEDVVGTSDGRYRLPPQTADLIVPFAAGGQTFRVVSQEHMQAPAIFIPETDGGAEWAVSVWVQANRNFSGVDTYRPFYIWTHGKRLDPIFDRTVALWIESVFGEWQGSCVVIAYTGDNSIYTYTRGPDVQGPNVLDGRHHHVVGQMVGGVPQVWVDGQNVTSGPYTTGTGVVEPVGLARMRIGNGSHAEAHDGAFAANTTASWNAGHLAYWDRRLDPEEIRALWLAGSDAFAGQSTGQRAHEVLDIVGVDPDDRSIDEGTQVCGATLLGTSMRDYLRRIAATEQGAVVINADGRVRFRSRPPNNPTPLWTYTGDTALDPGVPYRDVSPDDGIDRLINRAQVTRENGVQHETVDAESEREWGPSSVQVDVLHQAPSGARSTAARLVVRHREPRDVISSLVIGGHVPDVPDEAWLDVEVGDPVEVLCQPTGGLPWSQLSLVERVEHQARPDGERILVLGLAEHQVLPCFALDDPERGLDRSVLCEAAP